MSVQKRQLKLGKHYRAYSLLELVVTLLLTSMIMLALIYIVSSLLRLSAISYNRAKLREDTVDFVEEFEKDLRNASKVGKCEGVVAFGALPSANTFQCVFLTDRVYMWTTCPAPIPDICAAGANCTNRAATGTPFSGGGTQPITMCKYAVSGSEPNFIADTAAVNPISIFDTNYYLERFEVTNVVTPDINPATNPNNSLSSADAVRRTIAFTAVVSHPNTRLNINNIVRQSLITTKNFDRVIKTD